LRAWTSSLDACHCSVRASASRCTWSSCFCASAALVGAVDGAGGAAGAGAAPPGAGAGAAGCPGGGTTGSRWISGGGASREHETAERGHDGHQDTE
jgi:hypothetical protein